MHTSRPSSRNQQHSSTSHLNGSSYQPHPPPVRRAKVASTAQMDIGSMATSNYSTIKATKSPGSTISVSGPASRPMVVSTSHGGFASPGKGASSTVSSNSYTHHHHSSTASVGGGTPTPPRAVRLRSTNSVASSTVSHSSRAGTGAEARDLGGSMTVPTVVGAGASGSRSTGSVTSDDGTVSEDSDLARGDDSSPSSHNNTSPYSSNPRALYATGGRQGSYSSSTSPAGGPKFRSRTLTASNVKPVRMAAGAAMKVDTSSSSSQAVPGSLTSPSADSFSNGLAPPIVSTGPVSGHSTVVGAGGRNHSNPGYLSVSRSLVNGGGDDAGSVVSMSSAVSAAYSQLQPAAGTQPSTIRVSKSTNSTINASKLAEENRLAEEAARTRRKIADLKISNDSLLQINASLEATIRRQANDVQELKLRVAQLDGGSHSPADLALMRSVDAIEIPEEDRKADVIFKRLCLTIETMLNEARQALDSTKPAGVKVLSSYDMYVKEMGTENASDDEDGDDAKLNPSDSEGEEDKRGLSELSGSSSARLDSSYSSSSSKRNSSSSLSNTSSLGKSHFKEDHDAEARDTLEVDSGEQSLKHAPAAPSPSNTTLSGDRSSFVEEAIAA